MPAKIHRLQFQDEGHPQIPSGWRFVWVRIGSKWIHMQSAEGGKPRWKKFEKAYAMEHWPQLKE